MLVKLIHGIISWMWIDEIVSKVWNVGTIHMIGNHGDC